MKYILTLFILTFSTLQAQVISYEPVVAAQESGEYLKIVKLIDSKPQEALKLALAAKGKSAAFDYIRGALMATASPDKAALHFQKAINKHEPFYKAHMALISIYLNNNDTKKAFPHMLRIVQLGKADGSIWKNIAYCHIKEKNFEAALHALNQSRIFFPKDQQIDKSILNIYLQQEKYAQALSLVKEFLDKDTSVKKNWIIYSQCLLRTGKEKKALHNLEIASRLFNLDDHDHKLIADLYFNQGLYNNALAHYDKISAKEMLATAQLRSAQSQLAAGQFKKVLGILKEKKDGYSPAMNEEFHLLKAEVLIRLKKDEQVLVELNKVLSYNSLNPRALFFSAQIYEQQGKVEKALDFYSRAEKSPSLRTTAILRKARLYALQKQYQAALREAEKALHYDSSTSTRNFYNQLKAITAK